MFSGVQSAMLAESHTRACIRQRAFLGQEKINRLKLYFPLNLSGWTTWKVGFKLTSTTFVRLSTLRGALESLRNGEQHLDFTCYAWTTHHFRYLF